MSKRLIILALITLLPVSLHAATLRADDSLKISDPIVGNAYLVGADIETDSPLPADLLALGTIIRVLSPVSGDALVAGGTISLLAPINGDVRAIAGQLEVSAPIDGELAVLARRVKTTETLREARIAGGTVTIEKGAQGPVSIYGNNITLGGEFTDSVHVVAGNTVTILPGTRIVGALEYNAPQETVVPEDAIIEGGVRYVGSASFLPTPEEARIFAVAGFGVYLVVRIVAGLLLVGLFVGLLPQVSRNITRRAVTTSSSTIVSLFVLGFGILILTPLLLLVLAISVVGIGLMFLIGLAYLVGLLCAYVFGAAILGAVIARLVFKREGYGWQDAVVGFLVFQVVSLIPGIGFLVSFIFFTLALGAVTHVFYTDALKRERIS